MSDRRRGAEPAGARDCLHQLIAEPAARSPDAVAILAPGRSPLSFRRLACHVADVVARLNALGIGRNDPVAMVLPDGPELATGFLSIAAGAACAPLNPDYTAAEFESHFAGLGCRALVVLPGSSSPAVIVAHARGVPIIELTPLGDQEAGLFTLTPLGRAAGTGRPEAGATEGPNGGLARPDDVALMLPTSGTSGRPKLVPLTHRNICASAKNIRAALGLVERDRCLSVMPLYHIHGLSTIFASIAAGASVCCPERFTARRFFEDLERFRPTWYTAAPTIHRAILDGVPDHSAIVARSTLRFIRSASAAMPGSLIAEMERVFQVPFIEAYGMTEAGPQIASNRLPPSPRKPGSVGRAAGPEIAIIDEAGDPVPSGEDGEIAVRGPNVTPGYHDDPDANGHGFVRGWLRTGDRGRLDAEDYLYLTGRLKEIVNRGGEKISPQEVDQALLAHPAIAQAVTFPVPHPTLGEDLAVAIVLEPGARGDGGQSEALIREIRRFAAERLADFKVPQLIIFVDQIPAGPAGKVRRAELGRILGPTVAGGRRSEFTAPRTVVEGRLAEIWAGVLGRDRVGVHDNFFQAGGDSLKAVQVVARVIRDLRVTLAPQTLFETPTVAELAALVTGRLAAQPGDGIGPELVSDGETIPRRSGTESSPLSLAQQRLWLVDQIEPGNPAYNMHLALRLSGRLRTDALERSLGEILRRHEALRTCFRTVSGQPVQVVTPVQPLRLPTVDLTTLPEAERERNAVRWASGEAVRPFHLVHGPLVRATLLKVAAEEHILLVTTHHIVSDGWSTSVLLRELQALYEAFAADRPSPLPELLIQYGDFAAWQRKWLDGKALTQQLEYWRRHLEGIPPLLELPADRPRPAVPTHRGASHSVTLPAELGDELAALSLRENVTPFITLLAAFQTLLHRYTAQTDIVVGTPIANRTRVETEGLIGFFANTLVMRADLSGSPTFREALARVRAAATDGYAHQDLPFERLVEELRPDRDQRHHPLFQVMFACRDVPDNAPRERWAELTVSPVEIDATTAKFDLTLYLSRSPGGLTATWQYNTDLFDEARIARMAGNFQTLLRGIVATPDARLSELPLVSEAERREVVTAWNQTETVPRHDRCFHHLFEERARSTPDAPAVICGEDELSYAALNRRANRLAWRLKALGVEPETRVGVLMPRSVGMVAAALGVMKAGGGYVPLDPSYPAAHLAWMLADAKLAVLVTDAELLPIVESIPGAPKVVCLESDSAADDARRQENPASDLTPAHLAYLIYTSGSTGKPKGVMITHGNLAHCVEAVGAALRVGPDDGYLHTASFAFSSSVRQLAVPLSWGARVVVAATDTIRDPEALFELIKRRQVSIVDVVPSYWRICTRMLAGLAPEARADLLANRLRLILSASEPLGSEVPREWDAVSQHGARLINMFGQTETAGIVTVYPLSIPDGEPTKVVPIGRPIANTRTYVLDATGQPVPVGVWGELYIGGAGVGRGYLDDPHLTAERFVPDPFSDVSGARLYRTGDVTRYRPDGNLEFAGRVDHQIKIRGYRVEPGLIEAMIGQHPDWAECAVLVETEGAEGKRLVAYVAPIPGVEAAAAELREYLKEKLPDYMVPARIVRVVALPRTTSGKVDRSALGAELEEPASEADRKELPGPRSPEAGRREPGAREPGATGRVEEILTAIWAQVLGVDRVGLEENFFDMGGNSILAIDMVSRANQAGVAVTPKQLWQHQTIAELAHVADLGPLPPPAAVGEPSVARGPIRRRVGASTEAAEARVRVTVESLRAYGREALERAGLAPEPAAIVTEVQLEASLRDQPTHNMVSIPRYARRIEAGLINARPDIQIERRTDTSALIDGDNGPGQWVAVTAMETAIGIAREAGVGIVGVRRSNHLGAAGHYPWLAARAGLIGLGTTNGPVILAPTGGITPTFGNNPLAVGIPAGRYHPILLDIAMSVAPRGRIGLHLAEGKGLPPGWILDRDGKPSTDPADLVAGLGVPIGGHKGYGLTLVMEVLAGVLTGASFGWDNRREHNPRMTKPANFGHFFMAIDPELLMPLAAFTARVDQMIEQTKAGERAHGVDEILVPGEAELRARERSLLAGAPLRHSTYHALRQYGRNVGLKTELTVIGAHDAAVGKTSSSGTG